MILFDTFNLQDINGSWTVNRAGYLIATPRVARTGIQIYRGFEVDPDGSHGFGAMDEVKVYRPPEEVFSDAAMASFPYRPITNNHPKEFVDSKNWKKTSVGNIGGEVRREDDGTVSYVRLPIMVMDGSTVGDMQAGKKQFSAGYDCRLDWTPGKLADGTEYNCVQRDIRVNHVAVVDVARGGPELSIDSDIENEDGDDNMATDGPSRSIIAMMIDGLNISVDGAQAQSIINKALSDRDGKITALQTQLDAANAAKTKIETDAAAAAGTAQKSIDTLTAEKAALEAKLKEATVTDAKLEEMAMKRQQVIGIAKKVLGDALVTKDKSLGDIRKQVVAKKIGDKASGYNDSQVEAAFDAFTADIKPDDSSTPQNGSPGNPFGGPRMNNADAAAVILGQLGPSGAGGNQTVDARQLAYDESCWRTENEWRGPQWLRENIPARFTQRAA